MNLTMVSALTRELKKDNFVSFEINHKGEALLQVQEAAFKKLAIGREVKSRETYQKYNTEKYFLIGELKVFCLTQTKVIGVAQ